MTIGLITKLAKIAPNLLELNTPEGGRYVGATRKRLVEARPDSVEFFIAKQKVNIWDFSKYVLNRPDPNDPSTWDWSPAWLAAGLVGKRIIMSDGVFRTSNFEVVPGTQIEGEGGGRFSDVRSVLMSISPGSKLVSTVTATGSGQRDSFSISGVRLVSDACLTFGDPTKVIVDGISATSHYEMRPYVTECSMEPLTPASGYGILLAKAFDHTVARNDITGFARSVVELGSDLGNITHNRLANFSQYGVLQLSASTFGSQSLVYHNDILGGTVGSTYIKSTARHVRIQDNYLERSTGNTCAGFIDVSSVNTPVYGPNPANYTPFSVLVEENRIDGQALATDFVYRYEPVSFNAKISDVGTPGTRNTKPWLTVVGDAVPIFSATSLGNLNQFRHEFLSSGERRWAAFRPEALRITADSVSFNNLSVTALNQSEFRRNNSHVYALLNDHALLIKVGLGVNLLHCVLPTVTVGSTDVSNIWMRAGVTYTVTIIARMVTGTGTLRTVKVVDGGSQGIAIDTPLTTQIQKITTTMTGAAETARVGVAFAHNVTNTTDIEIISVTFKEVA